MSEFFVSPWAGCARVGDSKVAATARGHVLVVDDEPLVLRYLKTAFELHGFTVWLAPSGKAALQLLPAHAGIIGLALIDLYPPDMPCVELLSGLRHLCPGLRCCVMGGDADLEDARLREAGAVNVVRKPLSLSELNYTLWGMQSPATY